MKSSLPPATPSVSPEDRRQQLLLLCALDRARVRLVFHPVEPPLFSAAGLVGKAREALPWLAPMAPMLLGGCSRVIAKSLGFARGARD